VVRGTRGRRSPVAMAAPRAETIRAAVSLRAPVVEPRTQQKRALRDVRATGSGGDRHGMGGRKKAKGAPSMGGGVGVSSRFGRARAAPGSAWCRAMADWRD